MGAAGSPSATARRHGPRRTTSSTGPTAARPTRTTWCCCARSTITASTTTASSSAAHPRTRHSAFTDPTAPGSETAGGKGRAQSDETPAERREEFAPSLDGGVLGWSNGAMSIRTKPWPNGVPCWADLTVPDVAAAQAFYGAVLGWEFAPPNEEFGGY